jgi:leucyl-tRNA synthetase
MKTYDHKKIEKKWQKEWEQKKIYHASNTSKKKKFYGLIEFPYPSGAGLHVGHIRSNTAMDIISRKRRMQGYNVLYPIGWDAFGLPTENYAIKTGIHPEKVTKRNTDTFRKQLKELGFSFDWSREVNTTDPAYYKWTQWIFLQFYKKGLAYKAKTTINWCPKDKIGLANEEVVGGMCERCGSPTVKKEKEQWMLAITKYADRLDKDLDDVNYLEKIKIQQRNWIGKSEGSEIDFKIKNSDEKVTVFTTRADTLFGATYVVLAPEHELVTKLKNNISNWQEVEQYVNEAKKKDEIERTGEGKEKTGIELKGIKAVNPGNQEEIPVWVADYVLAQYGTGAIMAVPMHDERDRDFAQTFNLKIADEPLVDAKEITRKVGGKPVTKYKLRDWVFSRQRYWGEPIPLVHCEGCGWVPVPDKDLPVVLPKVKSYVPTDNGESPLAIISKWVNTKCPQCKGPAKRETDTMPNWAGSSWYYLRYVDPKNKKEFASKKNLKYFTPVDWYNGGMEHTTLHLLYSRFWHKFLYDLKLVPTKEPYAKRTSHGMILASDGAKMSKSLGNTVDPKDMVNTFGADTIRLYEMFMGPFDQVVAWNTDSMIGPRRFVERVWKLAYNVDKKAKSSKETLATLHKTIKKISEDIEEMRFNTAVSALMICSSAFEKEEKVNRADYEKFLQLLAPFVPHVAEELWHVLGNKKSIHLSPWPAFDKKLVKDQQIKIAVQVNGKVRAEILIAPEATEEEVKTLALQNDSVMRSIGGSEPKRMIYVKNRLLNIVIS